MKAKLRRLVVDNQPYAYTLYRPNGDGDGGIGLRIWRGRTVVADEWLSGLSKPAAITPRFVAARIRAAVLGTTALW